MPTLQRKATNINGRLVHYIERPAHNASAPALVFLHGWRSEAAAWQGIMREITWPGGVYALDLPGFGQSPALTDGARLADYAAMVEAFIAKRALKRVIIVGHSFGGRIAIKLAAAGPTWLQGLILTGAAGVERSVEGGLKRTVLGGAAKLVKPVFTPAFMQPLRKRIYRLLGSEDYLATPALTATFQAIINEDITPLLQHVGVPTLLVWGADDTTTPPAYGELMERMVPNTTLVTIAGAGHYSFIDKPQAFLAALHHYLKT